MPGSYLVYIYRARAPEKHPDSAMLTPANLLIPPAFINRKPWAKGYFETVDHRPLRSGDLLAQHCFWSNGKQTFVDEKGVPMPRGNEPCGEWALASERSLDDRVSDALGISRAPE